MKAAFLYSFQLLIARSLLKEAIPSGFPHSKLFKAEEHTVIFCDFSTYASHLSLTAFPLLHGRTTDHA
jgi:hypothetical protein